MLIPFLLFHLCKADQTKKQKAVVEIRAPFVCVPQELKLAKNGVKIEFSMSACFNFKPSVWKMKHSFMPFLNHANSSSFLFIYLDFTYYSDFITRHRFVSHALLIELQRSLIFL